MTIYTVFHLEQLKRPTRIHRDSVGSESIKADNAGVLAENGLFKKLLDVL